MATLLLLGFSSGLPLALTADTLQIWLKDAGVDLGTIGLFSLVGVPYTLKFLWAPFIDRYVVPILGRRRGWLLLTQLLLIASIVLLAMVGPTMGPMVLFAMTLLTAFFSASQDIVVDAYRADVLPEPERAAGAGVLIAGYRVAMILSTTGALVLNDTWGFSWQTVYGAMAGLMTIGLLATLFAPEPPLVSPPATLMEAVVEPLREFISRPQGWLVLIFVTVFRLPDVMAGAMTNPFMLDIGISKADIAWVRQFFGIGVTIGGALIGGVIVAKIGLRRSLWLFAILQALSNAGFLALAQAGPDRKVMTIVICIENFAGGLTTAGFAAFLMSQCNARYSATQYALLSSLMALTRVIAGTPTGFLAQHIGWSGFFAATIVTGLPGLLMLSFLKFNALESEEARGFEVATAGNESRGR